MEHFPPLFYAHYFGFRQGCGTDAGRAEKPLRFMGNADRFPPVGQLPRKEVWLMEQFLLDVLASTLAAVIAAIVIRRLGL